MSSCGSVNAQSHNMAQLGPVVALAPIDSTRMMHTSRVPRRSEQRLIHGRQLRYVQPAWRHMAGAHHMVFIRMEAAQDEQLGMTCHSMPIWASKACVQCCSERASRSTAAFLLHAAALRLALSFMRPVLLWSSRRRQKPHRSICQQNAAPSTSLAFLCRGLRSPCLLSQRAPL